MWNYKAFNQIGYLFLINLAIWRLSLVWYGKIKSASSGQKRYFISLHMHRFITLCLIDVSLCVIHKEGLCHMSGGINRLMMFIDPSLGGLTSARRPIVKSICRIFITTWWKTCCADLILWDKGRKNNMIFIADRDLVLIFSRQSSQNLDSFEDFTILGNRKRNLDN
jgi:hypothetical protein